MATQPCTTVIQQLHPHTNVREWANLAAGDDGEWILMGHYNDKSLHVYGTWGGATVTLQGSSEDVPSSANAVSLTDPTQTQISLSANGLRQVLENPLNMRVLVTGGDGTTSLTARLVCRT